MHHGAPLFVYQNELVVLCKGSRQTESDVKAVAASDESGRRARYATTTAVPVDNGSEQLIRAAGDVRGRAGNDLRRHHLSPPRQN